MSRRSNQKLKLLYLSKILTDKTDERHGMTLSEILTELSKYGIETGRKSLYDDLEALRVYGYDICSRRDRFVRYYLGARKLERAELKLIADLIASSSVVSDTKYSELIKKLWQSEYMSGITPPRRSGEIVGCNDDLYKNIEIVCNAIAEGRAITFKYFEWNAHRQRILSREGQKITLTPHRLEMRLGRYHIIGFDHTTNETVELLPERMISLTSIEQPSKPEAEPQSISPSVTYTNLRLTCKNEMASYVFDRFGANVTVLSNRDTEFDVAVKAEINDSFLSWVFLSGRKIKIVSPDWVAQKFESLVLGETEESVK